MKYYLGVDIGGSHTKVLLLRGLRKQRQNVVAYFDTPKHPWRLETDLGRMIAGLHKKQGVRLTGIGVGIGGTLDIEQKKVIRAPNLPQYDGWQAVHFFRRFAPARFGNDAQCFLRAEQAFGAAKGRSSAFGVVIGTGIGGAFFADGRMILGAHGSAGEVGHMIMDVARERTFEDLGALRGFLKYGETNRVIGIGVASIINAFDPEIVVVGGGGVYAKNFDIGKIRLAARPHIASPRARSTPIIKGALGEYAAAFGAALLFAD